MQTHGERWVAVFPTVMSPMCSVRLEISYVITIYDAPEKAQCAPDLKPPRILILENSLRVTWL